MKKKWLIVLLAAFVVSAGYVLTFYLVWKHHRPEVFLVIPKPALYLAGIWLHSFIVVIPLAFLFAHSLRAASGRKIFSKVLLKAAVALPMLGLAGLVFFLLVPAMQLETLDPVFSFLTWFSATSLFVGVSLFLGNVGRRRRTLKIFALPFVLSMAGYFLFIKAAEMSAYKSVVTIALAILVAIVGLGLWLLLRRKFRNAWLRGTAFLVIATLAGYSICLIGAPANLEQLYKLYVVRYESIAGYQYNRGNRELRVSAFLMERPEAMLPRLSSMRFVMPLDGLLGRVSCWSDLSEREMARQCEILLSAIQSETDSPYRDDALCVVALSEGALWLYSSIKVEAVVKGEDVFNLEPWTKKNLLFIRIPEDPQVLSDVVRLMAAWRGKEGYLAISEIFAEPQRAVNLHEWSPLCFSYYIGTMTRAVKEFGVEYPPHIRILKRETAADFQSMLSEKIPGLHFEKNRPLRTLDTNLHELAIDKEEAQVAFDETANRIWVWGEFLSLFDYPSGAYRGSTYVDPYDLRWPPSSNYKAVLLAHGGSVYFVYDETAALVIDGEWLAQRLFKREGWSTFKKTLESPLVTREDPGENLGGLGWLEFLYFEPVFINESSDALKKKFLPEILTQVRQMGEDEEVFKRCLDAIYSNPLYHYLDYFPFVIKRGKYRGVEAWIFYCQFKEGQHHCCCTVPVYAVSIKTSRLLAVDPQIYEFAFP